jgi:hypothetical protein
MYWCLVVFSYKPDSLTDLRAHLLFFILFLPSYHSGQALKKDKILADLARQISPDGDDDDAGRVGLCTLFWRRDLDFQPPSGGLDIGVCASGIPTATDKDGSILLRETGDDASYAEGWRRLPGTSTGPFMALELVSENGHERSGYWVRAGNHFGYAVGRPKDAAAAAALHCSSCAATIHERVGVSLEHATQPMLSRSHPEQALDAVASYLCVAGDINDATGQWRILHSTNPELVGCLLVQHQNNSNDGGDSNEADDFLCCSRLVSRDAASLSVVGETVYQILQDDNGADVTRQWKIAELTDCSLPDQ